MWNYEKKLQYPVKIRKPDAKAAQTIITQLGGLHCKKIYRGHIYQRRAFSSTPI